MEGAEANPAAVIPRANLWAWVPSPAPGAHLALTGSSFSCPIREALLAEMGVAMREDGGTLGVFSPKKVGPSYSLLANEGMFVPPQLPSNLPCCWPAPDILLAFSWPRDLRGRSRC